MAVFHSSVVVVLLTIFYLVSLGNTAPSMVDSDWFRPGQMLRLLLRTDAQLCGEQPVAPDVEFDPKTHQPQIVGGRQARPGSWPWMVTMKNEMVGMHWCGGTLVAYKWILTAAHCFNSPFQDIGQWRIRLGKHNAFTNETNEQTYKIRRHFVHPLYDNNTLDNDIALLEVEEPLPLYTETVLPLCLLKRKRLPRRDEHCVIAGWGDTQGTGSDLFLKQAVVPVVDTEVCSTDIVHGDRITESMLCAGYINGGTDTCQGDSGGPLMCVSPGKKGKWYLAGIASWGDGCAKALKPGVYTRVSLYGDWLEDLIKFHAFD